VKKTILIIACGFHLFCYSQKRDNTWIMGYASASGRPYGLSLLNFNNGGPDTSYLTAPMEFRHTCAIISDTGGSLLFYTNGAYIADASHDTMLNGSGINPSAFTNLWLDGLPLAQGAIIIPDPGNSSMYYLFHETGEFPGPFGWQVKDLFYSKVDMALNGGLGAVTQKNQAAISDTLVNGELTAVKHANGRDWWLISHRWYSNIYYRLLITPNGIAPADTQHIGIQNGVGSSGQAVFSRDGRKFAKANNEIDLEILDFDRCSGLFSNPVNIAIPDTPAARGVAFSATSNYLYVSSTQYLYQYDLQAPNIDSSRITVATYDGFSDPNPPFRTYFYLAQLAPDNKIYLNTSNGTSYLHVIMNPDSAGLTCNVIQHGLKLPSYNSYTLPNFPYYKLGADSGSICDTISAVNNIRFDSTAISVFPNPSNDIVNIYLENPPISIPQLMNTLGQISYVPTSRISAQYWQLDCTGLRPGVYFLRIQYERRNFVQKILIQ